MDCLATVLQKCNLPPSPPQSFTAPVTTTVRELSNTTSTIFWNQSFHVKSIVDYVGLKQAVFIIFQFCLCYFTFQEKIPWHLCIVEKNILALLELELQTSRMYPVTILTELFYVWNKSY
jgi:hypothetical protein